MVIHFTQPQVAKLGLKAHYNEIWFSEGNMTKLNKILNRLIRPKKDWNLEKSIPLVNSKFGRIDELIKNKDVLDCGCVGDVIQSFSEFEMSSYAIHKKYARYILGVDIWKEEIEKRREMGIEVLCANVETMELSKRFDAVIAGDLIEHLANPGLFLDKANKHLKMGGLLYICTPNPQSLNNLIRAILGVKINVHQEHCTWYDFNTLKQILSRYGFNIREMYWQDYCNRKILKYILKYRKNLANSIIVIAEKVEVR